MLKQSIKSLGCFLLCATCSFAEQAVPPDAFKKYNAPEVLAYRFADGAAFQRIRDNYHQLPVCDIVAQLLLLTDPYLKPIKHRMPEFTRWTKDRRFVLLLNPKYIPEDPIYLEEPQRFKDQRYGLCLVGWYIHPSLFEPSAFSETGLGPQSEAAICDQQVAELSKKSRYLTTILDLTRDDLDSLCELRGLAFEFLRETFGVDPAKDKVEMYYHFPYPDYTSTLHLHVRVNQIHHPMEIERSVRLDDIIEALEQGRQVQDLIMDRQQSTKERAFVGLPVALQLFEGVEGVELERIPNPHYVVK